MSYRHTKKVMGFTLIEIMVSVFIFFIVLEGLFLVMTIGRRSWYTADTGIALQQELRKAMGQITTDLYHSGTNQVSLPANSSVYNSISFNVSQGITVAGAINWSSSPITYNLTAGQIIRNEGGQVRVVANNISVFDLWRQAASSDIVRINMTAQKTTVSGQIMNASLDSAVLLRN
ncbi:MAG: hypothetical protein ABIC68_03490 [Candidatus Omnitrophota bacterium]